jgi:hypothetical protein
VNESTGRRIEVLKTKLRETSDPRISEFAEWTRKIERELYERAEETQKRPTGRFGRWGEIAEIFTTKVSIEERVAAIQAAREAAEGLKTKAVDDVDGELAAIRGTLPRGELEFTPTGRETEVMV